MVLASFGLFVLVQTLRKAQKVLWNISGSDKMNKNSFLLLFVVFISMKAESIIEKRATIKHGKDGTVYITSAKDIVLQPAQGSRVIVNGGFQVNNGGSCGSRLPGLGSRRIPAQSCKAILQNNRSAPSGVYYIKTNPTVTKVYCYMENIPGCGGGGWATIMKTDGHKSTFKYTSALWRNKVPYHVTRGQTGVDHQETKLPTYWTMPFNSLCLGMKTRAQSQPNWIRLNYKASSLYSVIADGRYRSTSLGRSKWKSLVTGSSLQLNCNKEGFNIRYRRMQSVRIGIISNQENDCYSPDSRLGFGGAGFWCSADPSVSTGNTAGEARCRPDNGQKSIKTHGYILAQ